MLRTFSSLRAKLIAAFVAVIAISLLLASATFAYLLREYQIQTEEDRLERSPSLHAARWCAGRARPIAETISAQLDQTADDSGVRILLLDDRGTVLHDTDNNLFTGRTFSIPPDLADVRTFSGAGVDAVWGRSLHRRAAFGDPRCSCSPGMRVAVIAPEQSLTTPGATFCPGSRWPR